MCIINNMGKKKCKKEIDYTDLTASDIKDMIVRDSSDLKYERVNITIPSSVKQKIDTYFSDEPRSNLITRLLLNELEKKEREVFLKTEAKKVSKNANLYRDIQEDFEKLSMEAWDELLP